MTNVNSCRPRAFTAALLATLLFLSPAARADDAELTASRWYGYQTLAIDGAAAVLFSTGVYLSASALARDGDTIPTAGIALGTVGATTYLLGGPIVHFGHRRVGVGFASLGLRLFAPLAGAGLGALGSQFATGSKNQIGIPIGAGVGALGAIAVDAAVLGFEHRPDAPVLAAKRRVLRPAVTVGRGGATVLSVGGGF